MDVQTQPRIGLASSALVLTIALVVVSLIEVDTFTGVVSLVALSCIPVQVVLAVHWTHDTRPGSRLAEHSRQARGAILSAIMLGVGVTAAVFFQATLGGGQGAHFPPLAMFSIVAIIATFWLAIVLGGWPFVLLRSRPAASVCLLLACYTVAYLLFQTLFNFQFLTSSPLYVAALDPSGLFDAWHVLVFLATAITGMFLLPSFAFWPLARTTQPVRGLIWTAICLAWAGVLFTLGVGAFDLDVVTFLIRIPIPMLFGGLIVLNVLGGSLYNYVKQPLKGMLTMTTSMAIGSALMLVFQAASLTLSDTLSWGPPIYQSELWLASATLAITFPLLAIHADFFGFWPLRSALSVTAKE